MLNPITELRKIVEADGSEYRAAKKLELTRQYVNDLLTGDRQPGPKLIDALGLEVRYFRKRKLPGEKRCPR